MADPEVRPPGVLDAQSHTHTKHDNYVICDLICLKPLIACLCALIKIKTMLHVCVIRGLTFLSRIFITNMFLF